MCEEKIRVYIYGAGFRYKKLITEYTDLTNAWQILGIVTTTDIGKDTMDGYRVIRPNEIEHLKAQYIIVAVDEWKEIEKLLLLQGIAANKIIHYSFLIGDYISYKYLETSSVTDFKSKNLFDSKKEPIEFLNLWFDDAKFERDDRVLLIGDSVTREYRSSLANIIQSPVDCFCTSASITTEAFWRQLEFALSFKEYQPRKVHLQIAIHETRTHTLWREGTNIDDYERMYDKLVRRIIEYAPDLTVASSIPVVCEDNLSQLDDYLNNQIIERNEVAKMIAERYNLKFNDLYNFGLETMQREEGLYRDQYHHNPAGRVLVAKQCARAMEILVENPLKKSGNITK